VRGRSPPMVNYGSLFREHKFSTGDTLRTSCRSATKFGIVRGLTNGHLFLEFGELRSRCTAIPCGDMHQYFTDALVIIMAALWNRADHYIFALWFLSFSFFCLFSSPNLSGRRLDVYHTSTYVVALVRI